ncbi:MAG: hypothetical protein Q4G24_07300 [Paracoccus sp. (in: a-proteobacteria)]|uniref:hypothetical protein n=1 Tax=Paracoccus sp. TaxID=267 RepID=UPI0026E0C9D3|nr:hypothetical protein [Paracoccus sp. (in: a-proteobacteria)]MDO5621260.1 hypothetical protein [Paracoccus sp. (in: a-proteobacteria)]
MRIVGPESPLWWRIIAAAIPFVAAAVGFSEGYVPVSVLFAGIGAFVFHRLFLT